MLKTKHISGNRFRVEGACVDIEFLVLGPLANNTYIIGDGETCFVVDPGYHVEQILEALGNRKLAAILLTHCHYDHVGAARELKEATGAAVVASEVDARHIEIPLSRYGAAERSPCTVDCRLADGEVFELGKMQWKSLLTPGHTKGCMCWWLASDFGNHVEGAPVLISGDVLFRGAHGRTDFFEGDAGEMRRSLAKLAQLPPETLVLPGHESLTTITRELPGVLS